ncbi:MAG: ATP-dependent DNA helicase PcrA [Deltaproteobacteria bacterium]|nr:MAG: ATP-dependent DNA helicase PcrA [Deltaproteobacteria bacterium]
MSEEAAPAEETPSHLIRLNPEQYDAVTTLEGPLLILAGAGSGKTRVLTRRIAHLLHTGVDPKNILAVTFTNKAASEMKERVAELVGEAGTRVWVSTFHSSCARILRSDIEALGWTRRFAIYDDDDQLRMLKDIVKREGYDEQKGFAKKILSQIDHHKNRMTSIDDLLTTKRTHINDPLIRVWRLYEEALRSADAIDFNDLIGLVVRLFSEHEEIRDKWRERFHYVLVDEYQDTNNAQYRLLRHLADGHRNLAVVGDDDQSIYGFRGADVTNILNFQNDYPEAKVVRLEQNYRSTANILAVSNAVIAKNSDRLEKSLRTDQGGGAPVNLKSVPDAEREAEFVLQAIQTLRVRKNFTYADMAVIYRTNAMSRPIERVLARQRIPYKVVGGRKFYERREIRDMLSYLRLVTNPADDAAFLRIINVPSRGLGPKTIAELRDQASKRGEPLLRTAKLLSTGASDKRGKAMEAFCKLIEELTDQARMVEPHELVARVIEETGYSAMLKEEGTRESEGRLENLTALCTDAQVPMNDPNVVADTPLERLRLWLDRVALTGNDEDIPDGGAITLMTVHSSKGLEYPVVFVIQMQTGAFPHARCLETPSEFAEERRLAYVAFTRAQKYLIVSRTSSVDSNELVQQRSRELGASPFLYDLPAEVVTGDVPTFDGPGAIVEEPVAPSMSSQNQARLRAMMRQRESRRSQARDALPEHVTLCEIEGLEDLERGAQLFHPDHGILTIEGVEGGGAKLLIRVRAASGRARKIAPSPQLRLVRE